MKASKKNPFDKIMQKLQEGPIDEANGEKKLSVEEMRREFVDGAEGGISKVPIGFVVEPIRTLRDLSIDQLLDKWEHLDNDVLSIKWRLAMLISDKFKDKSKNAFGDFLRNLRESRPDLAFCKVNNSTLFRYARAARFCEKYRITNLNEAGISPSAIYALSTVENEKIVDERFFKKHIKNQNLSVDEVKRLICQADSIEGTFTSEPVETPKQIENISPAQEKMANFEQTTLYPNQHIPDLEIPEKILTDKTGIDDYADSEESFAITQMPTDEEIVKKVTAFVTHYRSYAKAISIYQECIAIAQNNKYPRKGY